MIIECYIFRIFSLKILLLTFSPVRPLTCRIPLMMERAELAFKVIVALTPTLVVKIEGL